MEGMLLGLGLEMEPQSQPLPRRLRRRSRKSKSRAAPDLSEFDRDELPDDYQPKN